MKRYLEFDITRTFVLLLMPIAHVIDIFYYYAISSVEALSPFVVFHYLAGLGAAAFMICMGINFNLSKNNDARSLAGRGMVLVAAAVVLNLLRYVLPGALGSVLLEDPSMLEMALYSSAASDILYFAALYMLFLALMKALKVRPLFIVFITALMSIADYFIAGNHIPGHLLLEGLVGNFVFIDEYSSFAFLQWAIIPSIGYAFGYYWKRAESEGKGEKFWRRTALSGLIAVAVILLIFGLAGVNILSVTGNQDGSYNMPLIGAVLVTAIALVVMYIIHLIAPHIHGEKLTRFFVSFSKGITVYYMLQWILIVWGAAVLYVIGFNGSTASLSTVQDLLYYIAVTLVCTVITLVYQNKKSARKKRKGAADLK